MDPLPPSTRWCYFIYLFVCKTFSFYLQMSCLSKQVSVSVLMIFVVSTLSLSCYLQFVRLGISISKTFSFSISRCWHHRSADSTSCCWFRWLPLLPNFPPVWSSGGRELPCNVIAWFIIFSSFVGFFSYLRRPNLYYLRIINKKNHMIYCIRFVYK